MTSAIKSFWKKHAKVRDTLFTECKPVVCADGFTMSVQASAFHYCSPRETIKSGDYSAWEVGFPSAKDDALMPFCEDPDKPTDTVYGYVPTAIVNDVIGRHGGISEI